MKWLLLFLICFFIPSTALAVSFTEIAYDIAGADSGREWVEIRNDSPNAIDLTGWYFFDKTYHKLSPPPDRSSSLLVPPGEYAVLADNVTLFLADNPQFSGLVFDTAMSLPNYSKNRTAPVLLGLADREKQLLFTVEYWPTENGKDGLPLALMEDGTWADAGMVGGSPGLPNPPPQKKEYSRAVLLSEIVANPPGPDANNEWVELYNNSPDQVALDGWVIADKPTAGGQQQRHKIADGTVISPYGYLVITLRASFLNNKDETVFLLWPNGEIIDQATLAGSAKEEESFSRINAEWFFTNNVTPAAPNLARTTVTASPSSASPAKTAPTPARSSPRVNTPSPQHEARISPNSPAVAAPRPALSPSKQTAKSAHSPPPAGFAAVASPLVSPSGHIAASPAVAQISGAFDERLPNIFYVCGLAILSLGYAAYCFRVRLKKMWMAYLAWRNRGLLG